MRKSIILKPFVTSLVLFAIFINSTVCNADTITGKACMGVNNDSLVEGLQDICKKGDAVGTKHPGYFCDFSFSIAYNDYNTAMCIYSGKQKEERVKPKK